MDISQVIAWGVLAVFGLVILGVTWNYFFSRKDRVKDFWTTDREHREQHERGEQHDHSLAGPPS